MVDVDNSDTSKTLGQKQRRGWVFTLNNYTDEEFESMQDIVYHPKAGIDYIVYGKEVGKEGTPHLQGFLYSKKKVTRGRLKKLIPRAHFEEQKGTIAEAICYSMKDEDWYEAGERPRQGKRSDLDVIRHDILKKKPMEKIADQYFSQWCQYRRPFKAYAKMKNRYETLLVLYDSENLDAIREATTYEKGYYKSFHNPFEVHFNHILHLYFSKKYEYIVVPYVESFYKTLLGNDIAHPGQIDWKYIN